MTIGPSFRAQFHEWPSEPMDEIFLATNNYSLFGARAHSHMDTDTDTDTPPPPPPPQSIPAPTLMAAPSRGRPKGWRPGMSYAEMRGNGTAAAAASARPVAALSTAAAARSARQIKPTVRPPGFTGWARRGRPPKVPTPHPRELYRQLNTPFVAFLCEWEGCVAELHNLETLRRHVYLVHRQAGPAFTCQWGKCSGRDAASFVPETFPDKERFLNHMEDAHFVPFLWHVGDGPSNKSDVAAEATASAAAATSQDGIPDYLKDAEGNQVTPSIKNQQLEDQLTYRANRQKLKELLIRMDENLPSEESDVPVDDDHD